MSGDDFGGPSLDPQTKSANGHACGGGEHVADALRKEERAELKRLRAEEKRRKDAEAKEREAKTKPHGDAPHAATNDADNTSAPTPRWRRCRDLVDDILKRASEPSVSIRLGDDELASVRAGAAD
jgi:hypothetical protein